GGVDLSLDDRAQEPRVRAAREGGRARGAQGGERRADPADRALGVRGVLAEGAVRGDVEDGRGGAGSGDGPRGALARGAVRGARRADAGADAGRAGEVVGAAAEDGGVRHARRGGGDLPGGPDRRVVPAAGEGEGRARGGDREAALGGDAVLGPVPGAEAGDLGGDAGRGG